MHLNSFCGIALVGDSPAAQVVEAMDLFAHTAMKDIGDVCQDGAYQTDRQVGGE